ncbi:MAG TPA: hypothetical protein VKB76_03885 [Ktedonobacterales bacterium]|nr:hypothetical protein [Ktedonobacterales bacterium]
MALASVAPHGALLDFVIWDNDGLYVLVTTVSILFALALIVVVMRKSHERDQAIRAAKMSGTAAQATEAASVTQAPPENTPAHHNHHQPAPHHHTSPPVTHHGH